MEPIISATIRTFRFGDEEILNNIDINVKPGECVVLTGLSGCGKTTFLRLLNGLIPEHFEGDLDGSILISGKNAKDYIPGEIAKVMGNVFQQPQEQFFSTIAEDEVAFIGENLGIPQKELEKRVNEAFQSLGLAHLKHKSIYEMSGGEMQKVALASTLVSNAPILLLDEPSASLDIRSCFELGRLLIKLKKMGKTIVIAEHRLFYLKDVLDRLIVLRNGQMEADLKDGEWTEDVIRKWELRTLSLENLKGREEEKYGDPVFRLDRFPIKIHGKRLTEPFDIALSKGEVLGVIGENGAGKTTFLKTLAGLYYAHGDTSLGRRKKRIKKTLMLLQDVDEQLFFPTVEEEVLEQGLFEDESFRKKVIDGLKKAELWDKRTHHPHELSGGEKQRLALLIAATSQKELYLLDEISSGLDKRRMDFAVDEIKDMSKKAPVLLATHDAELLFKTCTKILVLCKNPYTMKISGNEKNILKVMAE